MKATGTRAEESGTRLKRGAAVQIMCYPRPCTKTVLVKGSRKADQPLSSFMLLASLQRIAVMEGCKIEDLVPLEELQQYAKRASTSVRGAHLHAVASSCVTRNKPGSR